MDGGSTWTKVLFVDENTGCSDLVRIRTIPAVLYAGMWQLEIKRGDARAAEPEVDYSSRSMVG